MEPSGDKPNITDEPQPVVTAPVDPPLQASAPRRGLFQGRLNRLGFLCANLYWGLIILAGALLYLFVGLSNHGHGILMPVELVGGLLLIVLLVISSVFSIGFMIRRFHDIGQSGLLTLLILIPGASSVLFIVLLILPGTDGPNAYGDGPQRTLGFRDVSGL